MGCVQQAVLEFDEEVQAPWRPEAGGGARRRRRRAGAGPAAPSFAPQPVAGGRLPAAGTPGPAGDHPAVRRGAGAPGEVRSRRSGRARVPFAAPAGTRGARPAPADPPGAPARRRPGARRGVGAGGRGRLARWGPTPATCGWPGTSSVVVRVRRHAVVDRVLAGRRRRRACGGRRDPAAQRARVGRPGARPGPPAAVTWAEGRRRGLPGRALRLVEAARHGKRSTTSRPRLRQPSVRARSHCVVAPTLTVVTCQAPWRTEQRCSPVNPRPSRSIRQVPGGRANCSGGGTMRTARARSGCGSCSAGSRRRRGPT